MADGMLKHYRATKARVRVGDEYRDLFAFWTGRVEEIEHGSDEQ